MEQPRHLNSVPLLRILRNPGVVAGMITTSAAIMGLVYARPHSPNISVEMHSGSLKVDAQIGAQPGHLLQALRETTPQNLFIYGQLYREPSTGWAVMTISRGPCTRAEENASSSYTLHDGEWKDMKETSQTPCSDPESKWLR